MITFGTTRSSTTNGAAEVVDMPRRHVVAIAVLMCVPLPLLSLAATVMPLPQIVQRAAATFISITVPVVGSDDPLLREKAAPVRRVEITYESSEQTPVVAVARRPKHAKTQTQVRTTHRSHSSKAAVQVDAGGGVQASGETSPSAETTDPPTSGPADDQHGPDASIDPPTSPTAGSSGGRGQSGGDAGGGGSGGGGSGGESPGSSSGGESSGGGSADDSSGGGSSGGDGSGGGSGANPTEPPAHGRDNPGGSNGRVEQPAPGPGSEPVPQPEPPSGGGGPPDKERGKP